MTPLLLTLASLTPGDGGPGGGAAREAVAVMLGDGFKGFIQGPDGPPCPAELRDGDLKVEHESTATTFHRISLTPDGESHFRMTWFGNVYKGAVGRQGRHVVLTLEHPTVKAARGRDRLENLFCIRPRKH
jgi:hypothetical protein